MTDDAHKAAERLRIERISRTPGSKLPDDPLDDLVASIIREYLEPRDRRIAELEAENIKLRAMLDAAIEIASVVMSDGLGGSRQNRARKAVTADLQAVAARLKEKEQSDDT